MYLDFYGFRRPPFNVTPDPEFLFLSPSHKEALASIVYGIEQRKGFVAIVGEVGVGKTTVLRSYLENVNSRRLKAIFLFNPKISFRELLGIIHRELGSAPGEGTIAELVDRLQHALIEEYRRDRNVALVIDEAQVMPVETLECLRLLSNLETSADKLLQIVLVGQPELDRMLGRPELRQLRQRIAVRAAINPLSRSESAAYVRHRLSRVNREDAGVFTRSALGAILSRARGIPRTINILCDNALVTSFGYGRKVVSRKVVREILDDHDEWMGRPRLGRRFALAGLSIAAAAAVWFGMPTSADRDGYWKAAGTALVAAGRVPAGPEDSARAVPQAARAESIVARDRPAEREESRVVTEEPKVEKEGPPPGSARKEVHGSAHKEAERPGVLASKVVRKGDHLSQLLVDVYGTCDAETISRVMRRNPVLRDPDRIFEGTRIVFPKQPGTSAPQGRAKERKIP